MKKVECSKNGGYYEKYLDENVTSKTLEITKVSDIIGILLLSILKIIDRISGENHMEDQEFRNNMKKEIKQLMNKKGDVEKTILKSVIKSYNL